MQVKSRTEKLSAMADISSPKRRYRHPHQLNHPLLQPVLEAAADSGKVQWGYFPNGDVFSSVRKKQTAIHGSVGFEMRGCSTERILLLSVRIPAGY